MRRVLLAAVLLGLVAPVQAQETDPPLVAETVELLRSEAGVDYAAWAETAARVEALVEEGRGSDFALGRLRQELVQWREKYAEAMATHADRIATVETQLAALGPLPAEGEPAEDPRVVERRSELLAELVRLRAPGVLAQEAFARADGLIGEIDGQTRSRTAAALLTRSTSPLDPRLWPDMADALTSRAVGLWKEVSTSVRSEARLEGLARDWPLAVLFLLAAGLSLFRGRSWVRAASEGLAGRRLFRGLHGGNVLRLGQSVGEALVPILGLGALVGAAGATNLLGSRAMSLVGAVPFAGACVIGTAWLARQFLAPDRNNPPPFDFEPGVKASAAVRLRQAGWVLAADVLLRTFLARGDIDPAVKAGLLLPVDLLLAWLVFRFGTCLSSPRAASEPVDDLLAFRRGLVTFAGRAVMVVAVASPVLLLLGFHRAGAVLLLPSVITLGLLGLLVVLQWLFTDLYALLRRDESLREALLPVLAGLLLFVLALPVLAIIWGARPEDLFEAWQRFLTGFTVGQTRISPRQFAVFGLVLAAGWFLTRVIQGTLRATVLPRTRLDPGAQNALVSGLGYVGIILAALLAVSIAGLDLSNLAIVAGALSVGIGFGLQNIVQNFVSGIILLIERPINEGDWIEVGGRMGYVRDISVRSTRIETFDRTDVIVPNGDLVSGQVVNWTRGNLVGRLILPVSVAFGNEVDRVTKLLRNIAEANPMVLLSPPPAVVLVGFGADVLNFEIRAIIRDVNFGVQTRSEINQEIARRFLEEGIHTAAPPAPPPAAPRPTP